MSAYTCEVSRAHHASYEQGGTHGAAFPFELTVAQFLFETSLSNDIYAVSIRRECRYNVSFDMQRTRASARKDVFPLDVSNAESFEFLDIVLT